jgi:hypothetical protein
MSRENIERGRAAFVENAKIEAKSAPYPEFPDPEAAIRGFANLYNRVVENISERIV